MNALTTRPDPALVAGYTLDQLADLLCENEDTRGQTRIEHALTQGMILSAAREKMISDNAFGAWLRSAKIADRMSDRTSLNFRTLYENFGALPDPVWTVGLIGLSNCYTLKPDQVQAVCKAESREDIIAILKKPEPDMQDTKPKPKPKPEPKPEPKPKPRPEPKPEPEWTGDGPSYVKNHDKAMLIGEAALLNKKTHDEISLEFGVSAIVVRGSIAYYYGVLKGRETVPLDYTTIPGPEKAKLEAALARQKRQQDREFEYRLQEHTKQWVSDHYIPHYVERIRQSEVIRAGHKGCMTEQQFKLIKMCLHPDSSMSPEKQAEAFNAFIALEQLLVKLPPPPLPAGVKPIPTRAELEAMIREREEKQAAAKAASRAKAKAKAKT